MTTKMQNAKIAPPFSFFIFVFAWETFFFAFLFLFVFFFYLFYCRLLKISPVWFIALFTCAPKEKKRRRQRQSSRKADRYHSVPFGGHRRGRREQTVTGRYFAFLFLFISSSSSLGVGWFREPRDVAATAVVVTYRWALSVHVVQGESPLVQSDSRHTLGSPTPSGTIRRRPKTKYYATERCGLF